MEKWRNALWGSILLESKWWNVRLRNSWRIEGTYQAGYSCYAFVLHSPDAIGLVAKGWDNLDEEQLQAAVEAANTLLIDTPPPVAQRVLQDAIDANRTSGPQQPMSGALNHHGNWGATQDSQGPIEKM